ncbi:MAG: DnaJ domain-containing protein [Candidatus Saganbacteria bacterium]|nr:DnaJ domain-containing protein [Candidatus Saganbacteria bacterium]
MSKINFEEIEHARKILKLGRKASLREAKAAYRSLAKKWHPDNCKKKDQKLCHKKIKEINRAYEIVKEYIENYPCSFEKEKVAEDDAAEHWKQRFGKDPIWGPGWET